MNAFRDHQKHLYQQQISAANQPPVIDVDIDEIAEAFAQRIEHDYEVTLAAYYLTYFYRMEEDTRNFICFDYPGTRDLPDEQKGVLCDTLLSQIKQKIMKNIKN